MSDFTDKQDHALVQLVLRYQSASIPIDWEAITRQFPRARGMPPKTKLALHRRLATLKRTHGNNLAAFPSRFFKVPPARQRAPRQDAPSIRSASTPQVESAITEPQDESLMWMLANMSTQLKSPTPPPPQAPLVTVRSRLVRRTKPVVVSTVSALCAPVLAITGVPVMSVHEVYSVISRMFATITRTDINQPSGKRGLNSGEILPVGVSAMIGVMSIGRTDVFGDIGSGVGSVLAQVALQSHAARCIGIEIRRDIASQSRECIRRFQQEYPRLSRVSILSGDVKSMSDYIRVELQQCTVLFCNNMVFDPADNLAVQELFVSSTTARLVLVTERFCARCHGARCSNVFCHIWERQHTIKVAVSWAANPVDMYVFRRRKALQLHVPALMEIVEAMDDEDSDE